MEVGPFEEHLRDAIRINEERAGRYFELSNGESGLVSQCLIFSERCSLPFSKIPDRWAEKFNRAGIPIVKEEFMPMSGVGDFESRFAFEPEPYSAFVEQSGSLIAATILNAYRKNGWGGASNAATNELHNLKSQKAYHPMLKHVLESVVRVSNLAPLHEKLRVSLGLKDSTLPLSKYLFFSHFSAFSFSTWIDAKAARMHSKGIPILHQDVPSIPPNSIFYSDP
jgi:hypothetical protein